MGAVEILAGIGGQDQRQLAVGGLGAGKPVPAGDARHHRRNPSGIGAVGKAGKLQIGVAGTGGFETGDAGENPPVHLGQHHMHRQIGRRQAARRLPPVAAAGGGQRQLEHRAAGCVERGCPIRAPRRKGGGVDDGNGGKAGEGFAQPFSGTGGFQRGGEQADRRKPRQPQRPDQRVNRIQIGGGQVGPVKADGDQIGFWRGLWQDPQIGVVKAELRQPFVARHRPGIKPGGQRQLRQRRLGRHRAAGIAVRRQPPQG